MNSPSSDSRAGGFPEAGALKRGETVDAIYGGRLKIIQGKRGYRFSIDSILLAAFARPKAGERVADLGTGGGVVALTIAKFFPVGEVVGIEIQGALAGRARRSVDLNQLAGRVEIYQGDLTQIESFPRREKFDLVLANPPFYSARDGRMNPAREKAVARHEIRASLADFLGAADFLLRNSGRLDIIYPAAKLSELVFQLRKKRLEIKRLRPVYSRKGESGVLILAEARKRAGVELEILPPLYLYRREGGYTAEAERMINGAWFRGGKKSPAPPESG